MARQRPTRLVMGPCVIEIDRIVIIEVQYQLEVNRCRKEENIVKGNFGWVWSMWAGHPRIDRIVIREVQYQFEVNLCRNEEVNVKLEMARQRPTRIPTPHLVMGPCIVEIDRIVIREVQYQLEVNRLKGNFGWVWPMWAGHPRIDRIVIRIVQYQLEVNRCRNEEIIVKGNFVWVWPIWAGRPRVGTWAMHKVNRCRNEEVICGLCGWGASGLIDRIVMHKNFSINLKCRNEEIIVKGNFGWVWSMWAGHPRFGNGAMHNVQYQFEVNPCRNEEVYFQGSSAYSVGGDIQYQFEVNLCRNDEVNFQVARTNGQTDGQTAEITTISPRFLKSVGIMNKYRTDRQTDRQTECKP
ncbi:hypothetical protein DPMN_134887 [Dreissena polymorpha]|uniref:Uncharacterized protein n=1 Tax=Dreissena polymorpha TaxID=45954 RepID=A0A9D4FZV0_DREPO|nr:hypothetical protein DPMN_134887 [Dreissena polymorpha]